MSSSFTKIQYNFFLLLFIGSAVLLFFIYRPFLTALVLAGSFAIVFYPFYERLCRSFRGRKNLAALVTVLIVLILILIPLTFIAGLLFNEARNVYISLAVPSQDGLLQKLAFSFERQIHILAPGIIFNIAQYIQDGFQWVIFHLDSFFSGFLNLLISTFIMIIALFFFLRDGKAFRDTLIVLSPLSREYDENLVLKIKLAVNSVIKGSLVVAVVQGLFASFGYWMTGIPNPLIWGVAAMLASLIPGIGTSLISVPAIIYLLVFGSPWQGIALAVWATCGIGLIDNFIAPYVLKRSMKIHPLLILISVLGGISFFGPIGFIIGPVTLAFFFALLDIYPLIITNQQ